MSRLEQHLRHRPPSGLEAISFYAAAAASRLLAYSPTSSRGVVPTVMNVVILAGDLGSRLPEFALAAAFGEKPLFALPTPRDELG